MQLGKTKTVQKNTLLPNEKTLETNNEQQVRDLVSLEDSWLKAEGFFVLLIWKNRHMDFVFK